MNNYLSKVSSNPNNHYLTVFRHCVDFIKNKTDAFTSEDVINSYQNANLPTPKEMRVFGAAIKELKQRNLIEHVGFSRYKKPSGHNKPVNVWQSCIYK